MKPFQGLASGSIPERRIFFVYFFMSRGLVFVGASFCIRYILKIYQVNHNLLNQEANSIVEGLYHLCHIILFVDDDSPDCFL
jgi:hypothetical protein